MSYGNYANEYRKSAVNGASPLQLVVMLYDGALRYMEAGKHAMIQKDLEGQNTNLQKAQRIISELLSCLDGDKGKDVARNLRALYTFTLNQLVEANMKDDPKAIEGCIKIFSDLRESWSALEKQTRVKENGGGQIAA